MKRVSLFAVVLLVPLTLPAGVINFETFADSTLLTNQLPGLTFSNATVLTAGISLNEFEAPPRSGVNVLTDEGPLSILFSSLAARFSGYFTHPGTLTLTAYDGADNVVASAGSAYANNLALSGDPGSAPNEHIQVQYSGGFSRLIISGGGGGGTFVLDDVEITYVPEPGTITAGIAVGLCALCRSWPRRRRRPSR